MEFDKSRVYTALNADELKIGSKVIVSDTFGDLKQGVLNDEEPQTFIGVLDEYIQYRFKVEEYYNSAFALAYLISEPEEKKLKWTDLKVGDVIRKGTRESMVLAIDRAENTCHHILTCLCENFSTELSWIGDEELGNWEKVENEK